jgi:hypothetical protein
MHRSSLVLQLLAARKLSVGDAEQAPPRCAAHTPIPASGSPRNRVPASPGLFCLDLDGQSAFFLFIGFYLSMSKQMPALLPEFASTTSKCWRKQEAEI